MKRFLIVTADEKELPLADCKNLKEVSEYLGLSLQHVRALHCGVKPYSHLATYRIVDYDDGINLTEEEKKERRKMKRKMYEISHDRSAYYRERYRRLKSERRNDCERISTQHEV